MAGQSPVREDDPAVSVDADSPAVSAEVDPTDEASPGVSADVDPTDEASQADTASSAATTQAPNRVDLPTGSFCPKLVTLRAETSIR